MNEAQAPLHQALRNTQALGQSLRLLTESLDTAVELGSDMPHVMGSKVAAKEALKGLATCTREMAESLWADQAFNRLSVEEWQMLLQLLQSMAKAAGPMQQLIGSHPEWFPEETRPACHSLLVNFDALELQSSVDALHQAPMPQEGDEATEALRLMAAYKELRTWGLRFCIVSVAMYSGPGEPEPEFLRNH